MQTFNDTLRYILLSDFASRYGVYFLFCVGALLGLTAFLLARNPKYDKKSTVVAAVAIGFIAAAGMLFYAYFQASAN